MKNVELKILLHYCAETDDYNCRSEAEKKARAVLACAELITRKNSSSKPEFELSKRGEVFVRALQEVPLPQLEWVMPKSLNEKTL